MFAMSKQSSAPSSDSFSAAFARVSRSVRSRSKSTRASQSTAMVPYVCSPIRSALSDELAHNLRDRLRRRHGDVLERRGERHRNVQRAEPPHRRVEMVEGALRDHRGELGRHAVALVTLVDNDRASRLLNRADERLLVERRGGAWIDDLRRYAVRLEQLGSRERDL